MSVNMQRCIHVYLHLGSFRYIYIYVCSVSMYTHIHLYTYILHPDLGSLCSCFEMSQKIAGTWAQYIFVLLIVRPDANKGPSTPTQKTKSRQNLEHFNQSIIPFLSVVSYSYTPSDVSPQFPLFPQQKIDFLVQSVALSAGGTTVELGLLGSGRLMASARHSD